MNPFERLSAINAEIAEIRTELGILDEQVAFLREAAEDARIRALVAETPLADREEREARRDLERIERIRDEAAARVEELRREQDRLLDQVVRSSD